PLARVPSQRLLPGHLRVPAAPAPVWPGLTMACGETAPGRGRGGDAAEKAGKETSTGRGTNDALTARWLTAAVGLPLVGGALWAGGPWWTALVTVVAAGAFYEWIAMLQTKGFRLKPDAAWVPWTLIAAALWLYGVGREEGP